MKNIEQSTIDRIRTRPRFKMNTALTPQEYTQSLQKFLAKNKDQYNGNVNREGATILVCSDEDSYWKPRLTLRAESEDDKTIVRGIFGPSSAVWTFFMFIYFVLGILWMVFITLWFVGRQIKSDEHGWGLPASMGVLALIGLTYLAARFGQKKAAAEMSRLRQFAIDSTLIHEEV